VFPVGVEFFALSGLLLDAELLLLLGLHLEGILEGVGVNLLQDGLQGDEGLLEDLVPVVLSQVHDHRHEHGESLVLVRLQDVQEVVVLEEAHRAIGHLQVVATDRLHDTLEQARDQVLYFLDFADLEDFLELGQEECLLDAVSEGPVFKEAFKERDSQGAVLREEEH